MERYEASTYGDRIAHIYDEYVWHTKSASDGVAAAEFLAALAPQGRMLELGIGTGRVAVPLVERGVEVHGIDASEAMVAKLRAKPGGAGVLVAMGDMADVGAPVRDYDLVFVVFNTFFALLTQRDQVRAFANVADVLRPGGCFVIEAFVPDVTRFVRGRHTSVVNVDLDAVRLDVGIYDPVTQRVDSSHIHLSNGKPVELMPVSLRFAWPSELDLMAELAGLTLEARHGGWLGEPFTGESGLHVSVWRKPG